ncbi:MAG: hypothetical protein GEU75_15110 [Dehalococcoidia bacterium]|nr:hypothetical protein [Dehalococcoidia bacterium]
MLVKIRYWGGIKGCLIEICHAFRPAAKYASQSQPAYDSGAMKYQYRFRLWQIPIFLGAFMAALVFGSYVQLQRDPPSIAIGRLSAAELELSAETPELSIPWPSKGSAAVGVGGAGLIGSHRDDQPRPIASLVKVMTAYVVLKDHPLRAGDPGPEIKVEAEDIQLYLEQLNNGESVILVREGAVIHQQSLLEGLLVPSGNNLAFLLARWSSGSVEAFVERMNQEAEALGMSQTEYADPSGVSFGNVSTAQDQIKLAMAAMSNPLLARIVRMEQTQLPVVGTVYNVNALLGQDNLVGVKTGWTEEAGACFLFAADWPVDGQTVRVFGAVLGQDTLADAFGASRRLVNATGSSLQVVTAVGKDGPGTPVTTAWGRRTTAVPEDDIRVVVWPGLEVEASLERRSPTREVERGAEVGTIIVTAGEQRIEMPAIAQGSLTNAGILWRLTRGPSMPW